MIDTIKSFEESRRWQKHYDSAAPKAVDRAPDFELFDIAGENRVRLSDFQQQRPVALIFGSFT